MKRKGMVTKSFDHSDDISAPHQTLAMKTQSNKRSCKSYKLKLKGEGTAYLCQNIAGSSKRRRSSIRNHVKIFTIFHTSLIRIVSSHSVWSCNKHPSKRPTLDPAAGTIKLSDSYQAQQHQSPCPVAVTLLHTTW